MILLNKKTIIIIILLSFIIIILGFGIWNFKFRNNSITNNNFSNSENNIINNIDVSQTITDGCIDEWKDYALSLQEDIESTSNDISNQNTRYLVKDVNGYIYIYYLDDENNETLYKKTEISTEYLSVPDLDDLEIGIEVIGSEELNKLLEDFE